MDTYHHGDLRRELLDQAAAMAAEAGSESVTLRELARRAGVSHSAPVHHFGTRRQLLTDLATRGFTDLSRVLQQHAGDIYEMGVAYVMWALGHAGEYAVMWQPQHLDDAGPDLVAARDEAWSLLSSATSIHISGTEEDGRAGAYAAFSLVHGLASLWLSGALPRPDGPAELARRITQYLHFDSTAGSASVAP